MDQKHLWIVANWKSNKNISEATDWVSQVGPNIPKEPNLKVVVCPPFLDIEEVKKTILVGNFPLEVGSQDLSPFDIGAHTGEEAAKILAQLVTFSIVGHSERRREFGETDQMISDKVKQALDNGITPILCIQGVETPIPEGVSLVAYEPIFAIGTGHPDTPENANQVAREVKNKINQEDLEILYGGSVTKENVRSFLDQPNLLGVLVGGASLDPGEFIKIVKVATQI